MFSRKSSSFLLFLALLTSLFRFSILIAHAEDLVISGNGDGSSSTVNVTNNNTTTVAQSNTVDTSNNVASDTNTGNNNIDKSSGEANITTGNVDTTVAFKNEANISQVETPCCPNPSDLNITVKDNGSGSTNTVDASINKTETINVSQNASINNNLSGAGNTGKNNIKDNNGMANITTGDIHAQVTASNDPVNIYKVTAGTSSPVVTVDLFGNGSDSNNLITVLVNNLSQINANNNANVKNSLNWDLNTGKNTIGGNLGNANIKTGDVFLNVLLQNNLNHGSVTVSCCQTITPPGEGDGGEHPGGGGGNGGGSSSSSGGGGSGGGSSAPGVLGLSFTGGIFDNPVNFWMGMFMLTIGLTLVGKNISSKSRYAIKT